MSQFIDSFYYQNPLSLIQVMATYKEKAKIISDFTNSPQVHKEMI